MTATRESSHRPWARMLWLLLGITLLATSPLLRAQTAASKIAQDLQTVLAASTTPKINWAKDVNGRRHVKVLIVSNSDDAELSALRSAVMAAGGSIYYRYSSVLALSAMLPASQVAAIAARTDVQSISPNRLMSQAASSLETITGTSALRNTGTSNYAGISGYSGRGVTMAVLDSGIAWQHAAFQNDTGGNRLVKSVSFVKAGDAVRAGVTDWTAGVDTSKTLNPASGTMRQYLQVIENASAPKADRYGHGTHVAAVAAGRGTFQSVDTTGIAPNAGLVDLRVLDDNGFGQLADALAAIDWVIYYNKWYNIRVMNLSLASDSSESYLTEPPWRAPCAAPSRRASWSWWPPATSGSTPRARRPTAASARRATSPASSPSARSTARAPPAATMTW